METNTESIIRLAWARTLGLDDDALLRPAEGRLTRVDESVIMFVALWEHRILIAPSEVLPVATERTHGELADGSTLLALTGGRRGRLLGEAVLSFTDAYVSVPGIQSVAVADDAPTVAALERSCPPDDVAEAGLSLMSRHFVTLDDEDVPTAAAGYAESQGILAAVGVLVPPELRRSGHGTMASAIATNDALDAGLIPQWRARRGHRGSTALARRLGYRQIGAQTTVLLGPVASA
ncbi:MAG TPA: GNAT family N-acetyltransferase [Propionibacteriaceae bacterium]